MELEDKAKVVGGRICSIPCRASSFALVSLKEKVEFILFFYKDQGKTASGARNLINSAPQSDTTTFALSSIILSFFYELNTALVFLRRPELEWLECGLLPWKKHLIEEQKLSCHFPASVSESAIL